MRSEIKIGIVVVLVVVIFTGCEGGEEDRYHPHRGKEGVNIEFIENAPEDEIKERTEFQLGLRMKNNGATDVKNGKMTIGVQRDLFEDFENVRNFNLKGKSQDRKEGERDEMFIDMKTQNIYVSERQPTEIHLNYCYPYETLLSTEICIDSTPTDEDDRPPSCPSNSESFGQGQGAPVVVTEYELEMVPKSEGAVPKVKFEIKNKGEGRVVKAEKYGKACSSQGVSRENYGIIDTSMIYIGDENLECNRQRLKVKKDGESNEYYDSSTAEIVCTGEKIPKSKQPYTDSVTMTLSYGYMVSEKKEIMIEKKSEEGGYVS